MADFVKSASYPPSLELGTIGYNGKGYNDNESIDRWQMDCRCP